MEVVLARELVLSGSAPKSQRTPRIVAKPSQAASEVGTSARMAPLACLPESATDPSATMEDLSGLQSAIAPPAADGGPMRLPDSEPGLPSAPEDSQAEPQA